LTNSLSIVWNAFTLGSNWRVYKESDLKYYLKRRYVLQYWFNLLGYFLTQLLFFLTTIKTKDS